MEAGAGACGRLGGREACGWVKGGGAGFGEGGLGQVRGNGTEIVGDEGMGVGGWVGLGWDAVLVASGRVGGVA